MTLDTFTRSPVALSPPVYHTHGPHAPRAATAPVPQGKTRIALSPSNIPCLTAILSTLHPSPTLVVRLRCLLGPNFGLASFIMWTGCRCPLTPIEGLPFIRCNMRNLRVYCMYVDQSCFVCVR